MELNPILHPPPDGRYLYGDPDKVALVSTDGPTRTYGEIEANSNAVAHALYERGLTPGDAVALLLPNVVEYLEIAFAARRGGFYYTPVNTHLTLDEVAYIVENCGAKAVFVGVAYAALAEQLCDRVPGIAVKIAVGGDIGGFENYGSLLTPWPERIRHDVPGVEMFYSSGTTGRPKGIRRPLEPLSERHYHVVIQEASLRTSSGGTERVYLSPAPLYHAAPLMSSLMTMVRGGTVVILPKFDPEQTLAAIERYRVTSAQFVPTMFVRLLRLPDGVRARYDLSSLAEVLHAAAPCPIPVKRQMIEWWGPIIKEYYNATEAIGGTQITSEEWLAHPGSVGKVGPEAHILDDDFNELRPGEVGTLWFEAAMPFEYHGDDGKTASMTSPQGYRTVGDVGYIDDDGYLFLTDRATFMIVSGGVNIYPQEIEFALLEHPLVADAAVFGVPDDEFGEEVKAVVQILGGAPGEAELRRELDRWCRSRLAAFKCPRSYDFIEEMPRDPSGKLYKKRLREPYWPTDSARRI